MGKTANRVRSTEINFYQYVLNKNRQRTGVIVVKVNRITGVANVGWSLCSKKDFYDPMFGMDMAVARMNLLQINPKDPSHQEYIANLMPDTIYRAWMYDGPFDRVLRFLNNTGDRSHLVPITSYVSGPSNFNEPSDGANTQPWDDSTEDDDHEEGPIGEASREYNDDRRFTGANRE